MSRAWAGLIMAAHDAAVALDLPTYRDPATGFQVWTSHTLLARGTCCGSGCRHCPYDKMVPTA